MSDDFKTSLDLYQYGSIIFYGGYGILCWFFFKWYCRTIYFRGWFSEKPRWHGAEGGAKRWTNFHEKDGAVDYMARGAGQCCLVMAYSVFFVCKYMFALSAILDGANPSNYVGIGRDFLTTQIITWTVWTCTELFYTYKQVEWPVIGSVHVLLCCIVLAFSIVAKVKYDGWAASIM